MRKIAILGFLAVAATLLAVAPASADHGFTVRVLSNGTLLITGDNGDNSVAACQIDEDSWEVGTFVHANGNGAAAPQLIEVGDHVVDVAQYDGVTTDVRFNMRGGDDTVVMDCGVFNEVNGFAAGVQLGHDVVAPRDVIVLGGSGSDYVNLYDLHIADDLNVQLGSGDEDILYARHLYVDDDMLISGQGGEDEIDIWYADVYDRASINTGPGDSFVDLYNVHFGRTNIVGGSSADDIQVLAGGDGGTSDLGFKPQVRTANGDDRVGLGETVAGDIGPEVQPQGSGGGEVFADDRVLVNTGSGEDDVVLKLSGDISYNINTLAGDDTIDLNDDVSAGDLINCGSGDDVLLLSFITGGTIRNCEFIP